MPRILVSIFITNVLCSTFVRYNILISVNTTTTATATAAAATDDDDDDDDKVD